MPIADDKQVQALKTNEILARLFLDGIFLTYCLLVDKLYCFHRLYLFQNYFLIKKIKLKHIRKIRLIFSLLFFTVSFPNYFLPQEI